ncbi:MAG TPA: DUF86 domain-containing protein [Vicinamibacteria bacterium]|nr:DUF86 domain-containing protein [Vicinamibacteria bacterium]
MVRRDVTARKVSRAIAWLNDAEALLSPSFDSLHRDRSRLDLAAFYLLLAIQECIDLAAHWVADDGLAPPDDAASTFDVLCEKGRIKQETADALRGATGLRNRIAHGYADLDHERVYLEATNGIPRIKDFLMSVSEAAGL